jgi:hypothetical protein
MLRMNADVTMRIMFQILTIIKSSRSRWAGKVQEAGENYILSNFIILLFTVYGYDY